MHRFTVAVCFLLVHLARALDNGLARVPPRGFSTWNVHPHASIDEATCRDYLEGMVRADLPSLNYTYFIVDEPCFAGRDPDTGRLIENATRWPTGLAAFGRDLRAAGMKLGIYTCNGPETCGGCVGSQGYEDLDMKTFAEWGAEYVKVDSCETNCTDIHPSNETCKEVLWTRYTDAIARSGRPMVYSLVCNCDPARGLQPWKWAKNVANSWRTNIDIQGGFSSVNYIVDAQRRLAGNGTTIGPGGPEQFAGPGHWNDMDMLIVGTQPNSLFRQALTVSEARAQFSLWAILKSPLLVSADLRNETLGEFIEILRNKEVLSVSGDPLGIEATRLDPNTTQSIGEVYVGRVQGGHAALLYNRQETAQNMSLVFADFLSGKGSASLAVRDLWQKQDRGVFEGRFDSAVPPHDVVMLRLTEASDKIV